MAHFLGPGDAGDQAPIVTSPITPYPSADGGSRARSIVVAMQTAPAANDEGLASPTWASAAVPAWSSGPV
jgi:hypothetical protein